MDLEKGGPEESTPEERLSDLDHQDGSEQPDPGSVGTDAAGPIVEKAEFAPDPRTAALEHLANTKIEPDPRTAALEHLARDTKFDQPDESEHLDLNSAENRAQVVRQFAVKEAAERVAMDESTLDAVIAAEGPRSSLRNDPEGRAIIEQSRAKVDQIVTDIRSGKRPLEPAAEDYAYAQEKVDNIYALLSNEKRGVVRSFLNGLLTGALERNAASIASKRRKTIEEGDKPIEHSRANPL